MKVLYPIKLCMLMFFALSTLTTYAQTGSISGKIVDDTKLPIPGVTVQVDGTQKITITDNDGNFKITGLNSGTYTITAKYLGYATTKLTTTVGAGNVVLNFELKSEAQGLDEVIVVGYGTQTKREVTGSIARVGGDKLTALPTPSFEASLQGRAAGVQVTQGSGLAGSGSVIRVRGIGSISAGGDPLYVIDGIPVTADPFLSGNRGAMNQNPLATINANDIESVEILKDAGAAGIYGSRGANGVILVTTKRGKLGKPTINFSTKFGLSTYANKPDFVNGPEWLQLYQEAWTNDGNTGLATPLPGGLTWAQAQQNNTDWFDLVTETGKSNDQQLSFSQGTEKLKTYISANYGDNQSFLKGNSYEKYGVRANVDIKPTNYFSANINIGYSKGTNTRVSAAWSGGIGDAMSSALPIFPVFNADGTYWSNGANPARTINYMDWKSVDQRLLAGITLELKPFKNFTLKGIANMDNLNVVEDQFSPRELTGNTNGYANRWDNEILNRNFTGTANYDININKSKITILAGAEAQNFEQNGYPNGIGGDANTPYSKDQSALEARMAVMASTNSLFYVNGQNRTTFASLFGRINYAYDNKYYLQVLMRRDGSSKFGPNKKYGYFPAASAAWTISQEDFLKNNKTISNLKLRASYGITGNANIPPGEYYAKFGNSGSYNGNPATSPQNVENPNLHWEQLKSIDAAIEFGFFNNRLSGEFAYYNKRTSDVLINGGISPSTGFGTAYQNVGEILNEGLELSLNTININGKNFKWTTNFNISKNYNEVISIGSLSADAIGGGTNDTRIILGKPVGTNFLVRYYGVDPTDGLPIWLNKDGYQTKNFSLDDRVAVGKVIPDYVGGLTNTFTYKGFELTTLFTFAIGGNIYDGSAKRQLGVVKDWNIRTDIADRWRKPGDIAQFPRLTLNPNNYPGLSSEWNYNSTMFLYDASFARLREITLAYNLPADFAKRIGMRNARIFATGMNLLTFTKYPGGDPEIARDFDNPQDRNMSPNVTYLTTPQQKTITFGFSTAF